MQVLDEQVDVYLRYMPKKQAEVASNKILAPMPGLLRSVAVKAGQLVCRPIALPLPLSLSLPARVHPRAPSLPSLSSLSSLPTLPALSSPFHLHLSFFLAPLQVLLL